MLSVQHWAGATTDDPEGFVQEAEEARDRLQAFWEHLRPAMKTGTTIRPVARAVVVSLTPPGEIPLSAPPVLTCSSNSTALPWQTQGVITLRTGEATRRGRGRIFIPYLTIVQGDDGVPSTAMQTLMNTAADELSTPAGVTPLNLVLYHRDLGTATNVGSAQARNYWAFLSSRRE